MEAIFSYETSADFEWPTGCFIADDSKVKKLSF
jgi:hypothetical protein